MDRVEGLMRGLKLSKAERKGVKIGGAGGDLEKQGAVKVMQAVGKVLAQKPVIADAVANALGPVWCPMKGVSCKELGEDIFLFNFYQAGGRKKAVDIGPWMFDKDLIVMEEYDPNKTTEQYEFNSIPIWVGMYKLPLGMMKKETGEKLGELVGEFMEMDGVEDGMAFGKCLRVEKECDIKLKKGEEPQFGKWLKWMPPRRNTYNNNRGWNDGGNQRSYNMFTTGNRSGSDAPLWWKEKIDDRHNAKSKDTREGKGTRPLKLTFEGEKEDSTAVRDDATEVAEESAKNVAKDAVHNENNAMLIVEEDGKKQEVTE
ncbi:hypothetical protein ACQ4PT_021295 [Festuca glaucescens]